MQAWTISRTVVVIERRRRRSASMTYRSSRARSSPARALLRLLVRSLSTRRYAAYSSIARQSCAPHDFVRSVGERAARKASCSGRKQKGARTRAQSDKKIRPVGPPWPKATVNYPFEKIQFRPREFLQKHRTSGLIQLHIIISCRRGDSASLIASRL